MGAQLLNRVGIIFSCLGGFLIAPELLGLDRIKKLENFIEKILLKLYIWIDNYLGDYRKDRLPYYWHGSDLSVSYDDVIIMITAEVALIYGMIILAVIEYFDIRFGVELVRLFLIAYVLGCATSDLGVIYLYSQSRRGKDIFWDLMAEMFFIPMFIVFTPLIAAFFISLVLLTALFLATVFCVYGIITLILRALLRNDVLQSVFVWLGIAMLIVGSAFQFIATF